MMDTIEVELPDGRLVEFPAAMGIEKIEAEVRKMVGAAQPAQPSPSPSKLQGQAARIGPIEGPSTVSKVLDFLGIREPLGMTEQEHSGSIPLPFTDKRLAPATAAMTALGGAETANIGRAFGRGFMRGMGKKTYSQAMHPKGAYSPNVKTEASIEDLIEMLTGSSHGRGVGPTPIRYADQSLRRAIDALRRKVGGR